MTISCTRVLRARWLDLIAIRLRFFLYYGIPSHLSSLVSRLKRDLYILPNEGQTDRQLATIHSLLKRVDVLCPTSIKFGDDEVQRGSESSTTPATCIGRIWMASERVAKWRPTAFTSFGGCGGWRGGVQTRAFVTRIRGDLPSPQLAPLHPLNEPATTVDGSCGYRWCRSFFFLSRVPPLLVTTCILFHLPYSPTPFSWLPRIVRLYQKGWNSVRLYALLSLSLCVLVCLLFQLRRLFKQLHAILFSDNSGTV